MLTIRTLREFSNDALNINGHVKFIYDVYHSNDWIGFVNNNFGFGWRPTIIPIPNSYRSGFSCGVVIQNKCLAFYFVYCWNCFCYNLHVNFIANIILFSLVFDKEKVEAKWDRKALSNESKRGYGLLNAFCVRCHGFRRMIYNACIWYFKTYFTTSTIFLLNDTDLQLNYLISCTSISILQCLWTDAKKVLH